jgi:Protein of unknown function (DUF2798)
MFRIPRRYSHFAFGVVQSGLTTAVAAGIASFPFFPHGLFFAQWLRSWLLTWLLMVPIVLFAAPGIRGLVHIITREDDSPIDTRACGHRD